MFEVLSTVTCRWSVRNIAALIEKQADFRLVDVAEKVLHLAMVEMTRRKWWSEVAQLRRIMLLGPPLLRVPPRR